MPLCLPTSLTDKSKKAVFKEYLSDIAVFLHPALSAVTELEIKLHGDAPHDFYRFFSPAAEVVNIMGLRCGALTHVSFFSRLNYYEEDSSVLVGNSIDTLDCALEAVARVCASSLRHLSFSTRLAKHPSLMLGIPTLDYPVEFNNLSLSMFYDCDAFVSLACLVHLDLGCGNLSFRSGWKALPPSLKSLRMGRPDSVPKGLNFPCMELLFLQHSNCDELRNLLEACPDSVRMHVTRVMAPETVAEEGDLDFIISHPAWYLANSGGPNCTPITELHMDDMFYVRHHEHGYCSSSRMLSSLSTMPSIINFRYTCKEETGDAVYPDPVDEFVVEDLVRRLHHIPRAFPNLRSLELMHLFLVDSDLTELHPCRSMRVLEMKSCKHVTGQALLLLMAALPEMAHVEVSDCELVSEIQQREISVMSRKRSCV